MSSLDTTEWYINHMIPTDFFCSNFSISSKNKPLDFCLPSEHR